MTPPTIASRTLRILPATMLAAGLLLSLKLVSVWRESEGLFVAVAVAEAEKPKAAAPANAAPVPVKNPVAALKPDSGPGAPRDPSSFSQAEIDLLQNLAQRRDALEARVKELDLRESLLSTAEKRVDERIGELKKLEARIQGLIRKHDEEEEKNLRSLVKVYENMKPKDSARIFEKLELEVLLGVVERMKEAKLAPVLAEMDPTRAQKITVELATRRQLPGGKKPAEKSG